MTQRWRRLVTGLQTRETGEAVALFRIAMAVTILLSWVPPMLDDVVGLMWLDEAHGGYRTLKGPWLVQALGGPTPGVVRGLIAGSICSAALMGLGVGGPVLARLISFFCLHATMAVVDINSHCGGAYDELISNGLWLLTLAGPSPTLSLRTWWRTGAWTSDETVPWWPRLLVMWQLVLMYWATGLQKVSTHWVPGGDLMALYYILQQPTWQWIDMAWVAPYAALTQVGTAVSWWWEVTCPVWLWAWWSSRLETPRVGAAGWLARAHVRTVYALVGVSFHLLVLVTMNVGPFSMASLAYYAVVVHPREWRALGARLTRAWRRGVLREETPAQAPASH
ncbi:MAG: hypothetical protein ACON5B_10415 [Myxococcota bacterium]